MHTDDVGVRLRDSHDEYLLLGKREKGQEEKLTSQVLVRTPRQRNSSFLFLERLSPLLPTFIIYSLQARVTITSTSTCLLAVEISVIVVPSLRR